LVGAWRALLRPRHHPTGRHRQAQIRTISAGSVCRRDMEAERLILQRLPPTLIRLGHRPRTMRLLRARGTLQVQPADPADILHRVQPFHPVPPLRTRRTVPRCNRDRHILATLLLPLSAQARRSIRRHRGLGVLSVRPALSTRRVLRSTARPVDESPRRYHVLFIVALSIRGTRCSERCSCEAMLSSSCFATMEE
jgi:hypothetical protein